MGTIKKYQMSFLRTFFLLASVLVQIPSNTAQENPPVNIPAPESGTLPESRSSTTKSPTFTLRPLNTGSSPITMEDRSQVTDEVIEKTLNDKRYLQRLLKCAVGEAPCDPAGRRLRSLAPLVLRGNCPMCTPNEQKQIKKVLAYVQVNFPKEWNKILHTYVG